MIRAAIFAIFCAVPVAAQNLAPVTSQKPMHSVARDGAGTPNAGQTAPPLSEEATQTTRQPAPLSVETPPAPSMRLMLRADDQDYKACLASLDSLGVTYAVSDPIIPENDADCGILRPLIVSEVAPDIEILPHATIRCETAQALAVWNRDFVLPASRRLSEHGALAAIENGSGYVCRRRNNLPDGKLSQHAFGNAVDIMGFRFADGTRLPIEPREAEGSLAEAFQDAVRASACLDFSTVLGPGSNASHDDHLHLDVISRDSGFRLCEQGGATPE